MAKKKYMSMQEELAARKAAAGIETPHMTTGKEPEKKALSATLKEVFEKGFQKGKSQSRVRKHESGSQVILGEAVETDINQPVSDAATDEKALIAREKKKIIGIAFALVVATVFLSAAVGIFDPDDGQDDWDNTSDRDYDYSFLYDLTSESADWEITEGLDEALEEMDDVDQVALNDWVAKENIARMMGKDIESWHASAGDKYIIINASFDENADGYDEYDVGFLCDDACERVQDALEDSDFEVTPLALVIARTRHSGKLIYVAIDNDGYYY